MVHLVVTYRVSCVFMWLNVGLVSMCLMGRMCSGPMFLVSLEMMLMMQFIVR